MERIIIFIYFYTTKQNGILTNKKNIMYTRNEILKIADNMERYGGSFFSLIGKALRKADKENEKKLIQAFPEECKKYLNGWK